MTSAIIEWILDALKQFLCYLVEWGLDIGVWCLDYLKDEFPAFPEYWATLSQYYNVADSWLPVSDILVLGPALIAIRIVIGVIRWVVKFVPLIGGS